MQILMQLLSLSYPSYTRLIMDHAERFIVLINNKTLQPHDFFYLNPTTNTRMLENTKIRSRITRTRHFDSLEICKLLWQNTCNVSSKLIYYCITGYFQSYYTQFKFRRKQSKTKKFPPLYNYDTELVLYKNGEQMYHVFS